MAEELGFDGGPSPNSLDAVGSRDALVDYLHFAAQLGVHLSRLGRRDRALGRRGGAASSSSTTRSAPGSSMLPQKKTPTPPSSPAARPAPDADLAGLLGVMSGLPLAYNKDLQEDKEYLFDAIDMVDLLLPAMTGMVARRASAATGWPRRPGGFLAATDLADHLVTLGWPFRRAHEAVGRLCGRASTAGSAWRTRRPRTWRRGPRGRRDARAHRRGVGRGQGAPGGTARAPCRPARRRAGAGGVVVTRPAVAPAGTG